MFSGERSGSQATRLKSQSSDLLIGFPQKSKSMLWYIASGMKLNDRFVLT